MLSVLVVGVVLGPDRVMGDASLCLMSPTSRWLWLAYGSRLMDGRLLLACFRGLPLMIVVTKSGVVRSVDSRL